LHVAGRFEKLEPEEILGWINGIDSTEEAFQIE
jgi:hypothetical protein